ncbi:MAG: universal stress protein [Bifidobacteriaceae bacterium]|jgi:nucleotide-binding universal stress UspA family protein|nr:universal stress protein [Bifidobacteriaceae bacterium]
MSGKALVLAGVDGSASSFNAVTWAAKMARRRGQSLRVVCAYAAPRFGATSSDAAFLDVGGAALAEGARAVVDSAISQVKAIHLDVEGHAAPGDAAGVLVEASKNASLVVVGTRGKGGFAERLLGTVSTALPVHAHCPTVVVPNSWQLAPNDAAEGSQPLVRRLAVGVDGSEASRVALKHAIDAAIDWQAELVAVSSMPIASGTSLFAWAPGQVDHAAVLAELDDEIERLIAEELSGRNLPDGFTVRHHALDGTASSLLVELSENVDLVVVGSRGRGGFTGLLLGSTSQAVLHHARCPVMVVPMRLKQPLAVAGNPR